MKFAWAVRPKVVPVMPGAAAWAAAANNKVTATAMNGRNTVTALGALVFQCLIAALLQNIDFGHQPTEVLGVVGQVIEIGRVQVVHLAPGVCVAVRSGNAGIENHIQRFT